MPEALPVLGAVPDEHVAQALARYSETDGAAVAALGAGLINETFDVRAPNGHFVLQRVNPIFDPTIHHNIRAVTERLAECGLQTPRLIDNSDGESWIDMGDAGIWRLLTFVEGAGFDVPVCAEQARSAGALVARFHEALDGLEHTFVGRRLGVHDTAQHLARLQSVLREHSDHRLAAEVGPLAERILTSAGSLPRIRPLPERVCHGDLKFNNLRFSANQPPERAAAHCLIDLDTVGPLELAYELGDAWRSWCNRAGEDAVSARFDIGLFEAAWGGYRDTLTIPFSLEQRRALLQSVEWISLELAARFAADALAESYFGWDSARFPAAGEHNLARARGQWALHESTLESRAARAHRLDVPTGG